LDVVFLEQYMAEFITNKEPCNMYIVGKTIGRRECAHPSFVNAQVWSGDEQDEHGARRAHQSTAHRDANALGGDGARRLIDAID